MRTRVYVLLAVTTALPAFFKSLSDPTRIRILNLLCEGEVCVCHLVAALGIEQPKISRHLAYLKRRGLVAVRRDGKWMHYTWASLPHPAARNIMDGLRDWMTKDQAMSRERRILKRICCQ